MDKVRNLVDSIVAAAQDKKSRKIVVVDLTSLEGVICQYFIICEGNTPNQVAAIADNIVDVQRRNLKEKPSSVNGMDQATWVGLDYGTVIVHIFTPEMRQFYDIDHLWADAKLEIIADID